MYYLPSQDKFKCDLCLTANAIFADDPFSGMVYCDDCKRKVEPGAEEPREVCCDVCFADFHSADRFPGVIRCPDCAAVCTDDYEAVCVNDNHVNAMCDVCDELAPVYTADRCRTLLCVACL